MSLRVDFLEDISKLKNNFMPQNSNCYVTNKKVSIKSKLKILSLTK